MSAQPQRVRCKHTGKGGKPCKAWAQIDSDWCWAHNPDGRQKTQTERTKQMNREQRLR